ncbi:SDR family NAD(P)-dependent oxidoreductase [Streptomyces mobaraensis]|uniref:SDR family NAD(P)-dependent oxidoreductase n=1 Tax=Streptomyces mobaraensis TaxID=35621 RepID=UPI00332580B9
MTQDAARHRTDAAPDAVAIVGMACRLPGGIHTPGDLWTALCEGRDLVTEVPPERFDSGLFVDPRRKRPGRSRTSAGGFLDGIEEFDAGYFGIAPREAARMDPQQRLLLETAVEALDDAGMRRDEWAGTDTGVFVGVSSRDFGELQAARPDTADAHTMTGLASCVTANRISHFFDWHGESIAVDTACSSALTALHRACAHLRAGAGPAALAGGVNVLLNPFGYAGFSAASMLSPTGRCRPFSAAADGYVRAEGAAVVVLRRLADALADGDRVHGLILATGANCDGRTRGLSLPRREAQQALLESVYDGAGLDPDDLVYFEAHGTGTPAGDPVECEAVGRALGSRRRTGALPIGSVKSNLGHLEAASGMAGLLKAVLVLRHGSVPPTLHAEPLHPGIDFDRWRLRPATRAERPAERGRPLVGVNSFGFGGANAHAVLAPPPAGGPSPIALPLPPARREPSPDRPLPLVVTAHTRTALAEAARRMADRLGTAADEEFYDIAHTACLRRTLHEHRVAVLAARPKEAAEGLLAAAQGRRFGGTASGHAAGAGRVAFVFSGNGSQWPGMSADLLDRDPVFRDAVRRHDAALRPHLGWSVLDALAAPVSAEELRRTEVAQPLLYTVQMGITAVLAHHGVRPAAVLGHSVGEIAAGRAAGILDDATAARVIAARSRAQAPTAGKGRMAAVGLPEAEARAEAARFDGRLTVAAVNSARDVTLAGDPGDLADLAERLASRQVFFRLLDIDHAFHSPAMDPVEEPLRALLDGIRPGPGTTPFFSAVTGGRLSGEALDAAYWWRNVREPVRFADAARSALDAAADMFVEIGPHPVTAVYLTRLAGPGGARVPVVRTCSRDGDGPEEIRTAVARLFACGAAVDRETYFPRPGRVVSLPAVPWQRERHWNGAPSWWSTGPDGDAAAPPGHPLLGPRLPSLDPTWSGPLEPSRLPWLGDHRVGDSVVLPAAAHLEAAFAAAGEVFDGPVEVLGLSVDRALTLPWDDDAAPVRLQVSLSGEDGTFRAASRREDGDGWQPHARGRVRRLLRPAPGPAGPALPGDGPAGPAMGPEEHYTRAARAGLPYGPAFRVLDGLRVGAGEVLASYTTGLPTGGWRAHPVVLDGALQACLPLLAGTARDGVPYLPVGIGAARLWLSPPAAGRVRARARSAGGSELLCDVTLLDADGRVTVELEEVRLRRFPAAATVPVSRCETALRALAHPLLPHPAPDAPLPAPERLADAAPAAPRQEHLSAHRFREHIAALAADALRRLLTAAENTGAENTGAGTFTLADLTAAGLLPAYVPLLEVLLDLCVEQELLRPAGDGTGWTWTRPPDDAPPCRVLEQALRELPEHAVAETLYARCALHLPDVVRGRTDARELLFAEADRHLVDRFYAHAPYAEGQLTVMRALVRAAVAHWPADRPLRVLEVGAGTGAMTGTLLDVLPAERTEYVFTDASAAFLQRARRRFGHHTTLGLRTFDIDEPFAEQGFRPGEFDVIVAHHALHVARDLRQAVGRLAELLADGGLLLATEMHDTSFVALCFGLLEEFWSPTDTGLRPSTPLLSAERWKDVLDGCGLTGTTVLGQGRPGRPADASVLLARRSAPASHRPEPALPPAGDASWVILTEGPPEGGRAGRLAGLLAASGAHDVRRAAFSADPDQWTAAWRDTAGPVHLVCLLEGEEAADPEAVTERAVRRTAGLAAFSRALTGHNPPPVAALWLVTASGAARPAPAPVGRPEDAAPWAAARCLANEHPALTVRRVAVEDGTALRRLALELLAPTDEDEVLLTGTGRFVPRVGEPPAERPAAQGGSYRAEVREPGLAHRVHWTATAPPPTGPDEVLIEVRAAGLNYRDIMQSTGLLRPDPAFVTATGLWLGLECAGVVAVTGSRVTGLAPGDRVYAMAPRSLASHTVADRRLTARIPDGMDFAAAATLPVAFLTVQYGLERLARLAPGETLLVHGAAGGVGLAAVQHARAVGARVIATAGTPAKRDLLRLLGIEHVFDSRGMDFAERVREATGGRGVDVVLNSLAGEALVRGAELLRDGGRFVELGKRDIVTDSRLPMSVFEGNVSFLAVDLARLLHGGPAPEGILDTVAERVRDGVYRPLPYRSHPAARLPEAMTTLRHSRHLGKVVVAFDAPPPVEPSPVPVAPDPAGAYLVTGGLTGLGAAFALHLAERGARHLVLLGRRGPATPGADALVDELAARGARAEVHSVDVCDPEALAGIVRGLRSAGRPLRGVVHAAAVIDDGPLARLTEERVRAVLRPKALGGLVLDAATAGEPLEFFVCCSSASALVGNRHQANYAAGNLFLESLVRARRAAGRPGLAVAWGVIDDTGHVAREEMAAVLRRTGLGPMSSAEAYTRLEEHLATGTMITMSGRFDWPRAAAHFPALRAPRFAPVVPPAERDRGEGPEVLRRRLAAAEPEAALELAAEAVRRALADVLAIEPDRIGRRQPFDSLGLDSLMAAELVGVVSRRLGCEIPAVELFEAGSVDGVARRALDRLGRGAGTGGRAAS